MINLTEQQREALSNLQGRGWTLDLSSLAHLPGEKAVVICVHGKSTGAMMFMVIEPDGYTHS